MKLSQFLTLLMLMVFATISHGQSITVAVEAVYPKDQAELVYKPLKLWLEKKTGLSVIIESADNYYFYWRDAKNEEPDFTLDASHVAAYRIQEKNYVPLVRLQEDVTYHLISNFEPAAGQSMGEFLVGESVVTLPNPNMGSILFDEWFTDLFLQPQKTVTALSWEDVIEQVFAQSANAAIVPNYLVELYPNFLSLTESKPFPGLTLLASPNMNSEIMQTVKEAMLSIGKEDDESYDILAELNSEGFIEANAEDYAGLADVLTRLLY